MELIEKIIENVKDKICELVRRNTELWNESLRIRSEIKKLREEFEKLCEKEVSKLIDLSNVLERKIVIEKLIKCPRCGNRLYIESIKDRWETWDPKIRGWEVYETYYGFRIYCSNCSTEKTMKKLYFVNGCKIEIDEKVFDKVLETPEVKEMIEFDKKLEELMNKMRELDNLDSKLNEEINSNNIKMRVIVINELKKLSNDEIINTAHSLGIKKMFIDCCYYDVNKETINEIRDDVLEAITLRILDMVIPKCKSQT